MPNESLARDEPGERRHDCGELLRPMTPALARELRTRRHWSRASLEMAEAIGAHWYCEACNEIVTAAGVSIGVPY